MASGAELSQSLTADAATYTLTIEGRTAGGQTPEVIGSYVTSKKPATLNAARRSTLTTADATASLANATYTGSLIDCGNSIHVAVRATFSVASQTASVFLALYDAAGTLIGTTRDYTFSGDATYTDGTNYVSVNEIIDIHAGSKVFIVLRTAPASGNCNLFLEAL